MIRLAVYDPGREDGGRDVQRILRLLQSLPNPPDETPDSMGRWLTTPNWVSYVDTTRDTVCLLVVEAVEPYPLFPEPNVRVWFWGPRAALDTDNMQELLPVMGAACEEVIRQYPGSASWILSGEPQGLANVPEEENQAKQKEILEFWANNVFGEDAAGGERNAVQIVAVSGMRDNLTGTSTVGKIARLAKVVQVRR